MKRAETVTFGGSGLDRAGEVRADPKTVSYLRADADSRAVPFWRGKPLIEMREPASLARLPMDHTILNHATEAPVLLGREEGSARFAFDISAWEPEALDEEALGGFLDPSEQSHPSLPDDVRFAELRRVMTWLSARDAELAATGKAILGWHQIHSFCACCGARSEIVQAGWQRRCPVCNAVHFPRTDPVVIMLVTHGNSVLLGRSPGWPEGMYSLLAGFVEPGETIEAAVRREVFEEVGVEVGAVRYLASQPWPFPASLMIGCAGEALSTELKIDPVEIEDALWVSREEVMQAFAGTHPNISAARKGAIARFLLENWLADQLD
ncbi:MAG: NAD(+) diphosphatase [Pseudomonadota bacterium]